MYNAQNVTLRARNTPHAPHVENHRPQAGCGLGYSRGHTPLFVSPTIVKKLNNIQIINDKYNPILLCLQETNIKDTYIPSVKNYKLYHSNRTTCDRASGGVVILARSDYPTIPVALLSPLEAIAITILLESNITICNLYILNQKQFSSSDIESLIQQHPFILVGNFNSHSQNWGSESTSEVKKSIKS